MLNFIIVLAVILVVAVLISVFRVTTLVGVIRGDDKQAAPSNNKLNAVLMLVFLIAGIIGFFYYSFGGLDEDFVQPIASEHGVKTDQLFWITMAITCFVFIVTQIFLFWFGYKYQHKEGRKADFYPHNNKLEVIWTAVPAVVLAILIISGWMAWSDITGPAPEGAEEIEVVGYQYAWAFRYGGTDNQIGDYDYKKIDATNQIGIDFTDRSSHDDFMPLQLHVPKGKPVHLRIRARDVIHSVYSPHFRLQMNAVPGMPTRFWFVPTKTTAEMREETGNPDFNYELVCNKICGKAHYSMKGIIVVDEPAEYEEWKKTQDAWLKQNPDYLAKVPEELQEFARIASGMKEDVQVQNVRNSIVKSSN